MRVFRPVLQLAKLKETTGLFGVPVHPNPRPALIALYQRIIHVAERLPASSALRQSSESLARHRLAVVEKNEDVSVIEREIRAGQIEELIDQAEDELKLIPKMMKLQPWEPLEEPAPPGQWEYFGRGRSE
ncbi:hypothetical protein HKX48_003986 [Thoreauomyces humboldtii]|nr:hypothetical protein HKX48_003986 [Thoreauomyces humboldtii]